MDEADVFRLVVDASVAYSASDPISGKVTPESRRCRKVIGHLLTVNSRYRAVISETLRKEWREPETDFKKIWSRNWLAELESRGRVISLSDAEIMDATLRSAAEAYDIENNITNPKNKSMRDVHLVEAAQATDKTVISKDKRAKRHFGEIAEDLTQLKAIVWVNPETDDDCILWLDTGASPEPQRMLGYQPDQNEND